MGWRVVCNCPISPQLKACLEFLFHVFGPVVALDELPEKIECCFGRALGFDAAEIVQEAQTLGVMAVETPGQRIFLLPAAVPGPVAAGPVA